MANELTAGEKIARDLCEMDAPADGIEVDPVDVARRIDAEQEELRDQLTATRTALAASEARETNLLDEVGAIAAGAITIPAREYAMHLLDQPRDDSALREMIAGVYEECAKVADLFEQKADALNGSIADDDDANEGRSEYIMGKATASSRIAKAIRALAEKAKRE